MQEKMLRIPLPRMHENNRTKSKPHKTNEEKISKKERFIRMNNNTKRKRDYGCGAERNLSF